MVCITSTVLALLSSSLVSAASVAPRAPAAGTKACASEVATVCFQEFTANSNINYKIAAVESGETLLRITAPVSGVGWAGLAWGGGMRNNPLAVAWPNDKGATISSRWATGHTLPTEYKDATYKTLRAVKNATHWDLEVACTGCNKWSGGALDTAATAATMSWAMSKTAVTDPGNPSSKFAYHQAKGALSVDLSAAKVSAADYQKYVAAVSGAKTE